MKSGDLVWPGRTPREQAKHRIAAAGAARRAYPEARHFQTAFLRGWHGRVVGRTRDENPYRGRTAGGTFTFAWRAAWELGWRGADER